MSLLDETRFIERHQFFDGQRLFAADLQGLEAFNREMRWLHNRSLHQAGIGNGFAVSGNKGERQVTVQPGYALDTQGREIVLTETHIEPIPPVAGEPDGSPTYYDLTVSYPPDSELEVAETRQGVCLPRGAVRLQEKPLFCWVRLVADIQGTLKPKDGQLAKDIEKGQKIVLGRAAVLNCQLDGTLSLSQRRSARPATQPHIACGEAKPTDWQAWWVIGRENLKNEIIDSFTTPSVELSEVEGAGRLFSIARHLINAPFGSLRLPLLTLPLGLTATIDTSQARFGTIPCYSARLAGPRLRTIQLPESEQEDSSPSLGSPSIGLAFHSDNEILLLIDGVVSIEDPRAEQFKVNVLLLIQPLDIGEQRLARLSAITPLAGDAAEDNGRTISQITEDIENCGETSQTEEQLKTCLDPLIDELFDAIGALFLQILQPDDWYIAWMGVEG